MKERYSYVVLVTISILLSAAAVFIGAVHDNDNQRKFCDLVTSIASEPAPKPADPTKDPSRARSYILFQKVEKLDKSLGC